MTKLKMFGYEITFKKDISKKLYNVVKEHVRLMQEIKNKNCTQSYNTFAPVPLLNFDPKTKPVDKFLMLSDVMATIKAMNFDQVDKAAKRKGLSRKKYILFLLAAKYGIKYDC